MRIAIIDLGTNSIRFDVHDLKQGKSIRLHREKLMVKLGQEVFLTGKLNEEAKSRTIQALIRFSQAVKSLHVQKVIAFATSAIREADDRDGFIRQIYKKTGIKIKVISGEEEARLIALGILSNEKLPKGPFALVDIGGGSTEFSLCKGKNVQTSFSFDLGVARVQQQFLKRSPPKQANLRKLKEHIENHISKKLGSKKKLEIKNVIVSSGTAQILARVLSAMKTKKSNELKNLRKLSSELGLMTKQEILFLPGMDPRRAELILAGAIILEQIMETISAKKFIPTEFALRDGILIEEKILFKKQMDTHLAFYLPEIGKKAVLLGADANLLRKSVLLCEQLFNKLLPVHKLNHSWLGYLIVAAMLKDSGKAIAFSKHEQHSYYIVRNLDIPFLQPWESEFIAELCYFHERSKVLSKDIPFARKAQRRKNFLKLLSILQIVEALDSGLNFHPTLKKIRVSKKEVRFYFPASSLTDLEILRLERKSRLFEKTFNRLIKIQILNQ